MTHEEILQLADSVKFMLTVKEIEAAYADLRAWNDGARLMSEAIADGLASPAEAVPFVGTSVLTERIVDLDASGNLPSEYKAALGYLKRQQAAGRSHFFDREIEVDGERVPNNMFLAFGVLLAEVGKLRLADRLMAIAR